MSTISRICASRVQDGLPEAWHKPSMGCCCLCWLMLTGTALASVKRLTGHSTSGCAAGSHQRQRRAQRQGITGLMSSRMLRVCRDSSHKSIAERNQGAMHGRPSVIDSSAATGSSSSSCNCVHSRPAHLQKLAHLEPAHLEKKELLQEYIECFCRCMQATCRSCCLLLADTREKKTDLLLLAGCPC